MIPIYLVKESIFRKMRVVLPLRHEGLEGILGNGAFIPVLLSLEWRGKCYFCAQIADFLKAKWATWKQLPTKPFALK